MLLNTPAKSKLNINTIYLWCIYYAVYIQELSNPTTNSVEYLRFISI